MNVLRQLYKDFGVFIQTHCVNSPPVQGPALIHHITKEWWRRLEVDVCDDVHHDKNFVCLCPQQAPERVGQSDAVYEVVSLQREAERSNDGRGQISSPADEDEADEGNTLICHWSVTTPMIHLDHHRTWSPMCNSTLLPAFLLTHTPTQHNVSSQLYLI